MSYDSATFERDLDEVLFELRSMLVEKNRAYGNSALQPVQVFSKGLGKDAAIRVRLDDKISRIVRGSDAGEDVEKDLLGYLVLLRILRLREQRT